MITWRLKWIIGMISVLLVSGACNGKQPAPPVLFDMEQPSLGAETEQEASPEERSAGGFYSAIVFVTGSMGVDLRITEYDGDGKPDMLIPLLGGGIGVLVNQSTEDVLDFDNDFVSTGGSQVQAFAMAPFDEDELPDLFILYKDGGLEVRNQLETGGFALLQEGERVYGTDIAVDYVNSDDSVLDVLIASGFLRGLGVIWFKDSDEVFGGGTPSWADPSWPDRPEKSELVQLVTSDIDCNGLTDALLVDKKDLSVQVALHIPQPNKPDMISNETGTGLIPAPQDEIYYDFTTGYGTSRTKAPRYATPIRATIGDFNNDEIEDVAILFNDPGAGGKVYDTGPFYYEPPPPEAEIAIRPSHWVGIYQSTVVGGETSPYVHRELELDFQVGLCFPGWVNDIKVDDIDGDGNMDLVGCSEMWSLGESSYLFVWPGLGNFEFDEPVGYGFYDFPLRIGVTDFNGDTYPDVAVLLPASNMVLVYLNDGGSGLGDPGVQFEIVDPEP